MVARSPSSISRVGGVTVTCGFWEDTTESLESLGRWRDLVAENADLAGIARTAKETRAIAESGRVVILLGFQNTELLQGRIRYVEFFAELGVRVIQPTYNNQNSLGGSCYEQEDFGLARITGDAYCASVEAWCGMVMKKVEIAGIDHVGIGTDRSHNFAKVDYDWMRMGRWTRGVDLGAAPASRPGKAPPPTGLWPTGRPNTDRSLAEATERSVEPLLAGSPGQGLQRPLPR